MKEKHKTEANQIVEALHKYLKNRYARDLFPKILLIHWANAAEKNKNWYFSAIWNVWYSGMFSMKFKWDFYLWVYPQRYLLSIKQNL